MKRRHPWRGVVAVGLSIIILFVVYVLARSGWGSRAGQVGPSIVLSSNKIDMGMIEPGAKIQRTIVLRNTGPRPVHIMHLAANCGCTTPVADHTTIAVGGDAHVKVTFDSTGYSRSVWKQVIIQMDDPGRRLAIINLRGYVKLGLRVEPAVVDCGQVVYGGTARGEFHLYKDLGRPSGLIALRSEEGGVTYDADPWKEVFEADEATVQVGVAVNSGKVGLHRRACDVIIGKKKLPITLVYDLVPTVSCEPHQVVLAGAQSRGEVHLNCGTRHTVRLNSITCDDRDFSARVVRDGRKPDVEVSVDRTRIGSKGQATLLKVHYRLTDLGRDETLIVPLLVLPQR